MTMKEPQIRYDELSDTLYVVFVPGESATGIELNGHVLLRVDKLSRRPIGIVLFDYSILVQPTELGTRRIALTGMERLPPATRELVTTILRSAPVCDYLVTREPDSIAPEVELGRRLMFAGASPEIERRDSSSVRDVPKDGGRRPLIFICHSSSDKPFVRQLVKRLSAEKVDSWLDEIQIRVGDSIHGKINEGLSRSDFFAIVLSKSSVQSRWVQEELSSASTMEKLSRKGVLLLPVLIEECEIPPLLLDRRYANFKDDQESAYQELLDAILHHFEQRHPEVNVDSLRGVEPPKNADARAIIDPEVLMSMAPRHFEEFVAQLLSDAGYAVQLAPITHDGGYDIIASREAGFPGLKPEKMLVQCKRWKNPVGATHVRELAGIRMIARTSRAALVTTSRFTRDAKTAAEHSGIDLVDVDDLLDWVRKAHVPRS